MEVFPPRSTLYRTARRFVIWASLALALARVLPGQASRTPKRYKGPRALGLIELAPNGKARLIPITILIEGEFYDASVYKASPVPMALWAETVYEGLRTGASQGLFTVTTALENQQTHEWFAEGKWLPAGSIPAKLAKKESPVPRGLNEDEGPPVLRHSGSAKPKAPEPAPAQPTPSATQPAPSTTSPAPPASNPSSAPATTAPQPAPPTPASPTPAPAEPEDKDRPQLKRGKPTQKSEESPSPPATSSKAPAHAATPAASAPKPQLQLIPAISDADGPDSQPYTYDLKPDEERQLRDKMLALAADQVRARAKQLASEAIESSQPVRRTRKTPPRPVQPNFEDVQFRAFDLSNSNEPVLVLTAKARLPKTAAESEASADLQYFITLVARQDINGDLNKAFSNLTDTQHLDVIPDMQLIDAVDADGDGRGELLFRQVSDAGTAYVVYRVIGDQLYALFQGSPSQ